MSERTRLDEIVAGELKSFCRENTFTNRACGLAIAERAFRHGVVRGQAEPYNFHDKGQPAPAGGCPHGPLTANGCTQCLSEATERARKERLDKEYIQPAQAEESVSRPPFKSGMLADLVAGQCKQRCSKPNGHDGGHEYPAEEKRFYCAKGNDHHAHGYGCIIDRRVLGERRIDCPACRYKYQSAGSVYQPNRRSGKDRRKQK